MYNSEERTRSIKIDSEQKCLYQTGKMFADKMPPSKVGQATQKRKGRVTTARRLLIVLVGCFGMLAYGYTTVLGGEPSTAKQLAQFDLLESAQQSTATPQQPTATPQQPTATPQQSNISVQDLNEQVQSLRYDVELMKTQVESELAAIGEANDRNFSFFTIISGIIGVFGLVTFVTNLWKGKQEHRDYEHERDFYEKHAGRMFELQEANLNRVNAITTAIASGAEENVNSLNTMLSTFQKIMDFKVTEAEDAQKLMRQMNDQLEELRRAQQQQVERLLEDAKSTRRSRHWYADPDPDLQRQLVEFRTQMDLMQRVILDRYTGVESPAENRDYGEIYLRRGIIAYCDNDIVKSHEMLEIAEQYFPFPLEQEIENMSQEQRCQTAFTQFYLALIEKNYGDMARARDYIDRSYAVYGRDTNEELLTPITRAEVLSYQGNKDDTQNAIQEVLDRTEALQNSGALKKHQVVYNLRAHLYRGNTHYVREEWPQALQCYQATLGPNKKHLYNGYYTYYSIA